MNARKTLALILTSTLVGLFLVMAEQGFKTGTSSLQPTAFGSFNSQNPLTGAQGFIDLNSDSAIEPQNKPINQTQNAATASTPAGSDRAGTAPPCNGSVSRQSQCPGNVSQTNGTLPGNVHQPNIIPVFCDGAGNPAS